MNKIERRKRYEKNQGRNVLCTNIVCAILLVISNITLFYLAIYYGVEDAAAFWAVTNGLFFAIIIFNSMPKDWIYIVGKSERRKR